MLENFHRIIDMSLLPFSISILGKVLGFFIGANSLNIDWGIIDIGRGYITSSPVVYGKDLIAITDYSNALMFFFTFAFVLILLLERIYKIKSHDIANLKLSIKFPFSSNTKISHDLLYLRINVALFYLWICNIVILVDYVLQRSSLGLLLVVFIINCLLTSYIITINKAKNLSVFESLQNF